jgi:uncharacterized phosphatase
MQGELRKKMEKPNKKGEITIIRHGSTASNSEEKMRGWNDIPLDKKGEGQADKLGESLKGKGIDYLITSDLKRAVQTAHRVSQKSDIPVKGESAYFRTWDVGDLVGHPSKDVDPIIKHFAEKTPDIPLPHGESFNTFKNRFLKGINELSKKYPDKHIGIVTHHQGERIFDAWKKKGEKDDLSVDLPTFFKDGMAPAKAVKETVEKK